MILVMYSACSIIISVAVVGLSHNIFAGMLVLGILGLMSAIVLAVCKYTTIGTK